VETGCSVRSACSRAPRSVSEKRTKTPCRRGWGNGGRPRLAIVFLIS
jgi:hypothetical protein